MLNADRIIGGFTAGLTILVYFSTRDVSKLGVVYINYVLAAMSVLSLVVLVKGLNRKG